MPEYLAPGVYVEEVSFRAKSIEGVSTTTTGFVGPCRYGPIDIEPELVTSVVEFDRVYGDQQKLVWGGVETDNWMRHAVRAFFEEGGKRLYVSRIYRPRISGDFIGHAAVASSPPLPFILRARFPGAAGNARVTIRLDASQNRFAVTPAGNALRATLDRDIVYMSDTPQSPADDTSGNFFLVRWDEGTGSWLFERHASSTALADLTAGATVRTITATVIVEPAVPTMPTYVAAGLALDPEHRRAGAPDSLFAHFGPHFRPPGSPPGSNVLGPDPSRARSIPIMIELSAATTGLQVLQELAALYRSEQIPGSPPSPPNDLFLDHILDDSLPPPMRSVVFTLSLGDDGARPESADYQGSVNPNSDAKTGLKQFEDLEDVSIVAAPGATEVDGDDALAATAFLIAHAERMRYRIAVLEAPRDASIANVRAFRAKFDSSHGALYYPWVRIVDPLTGEAGNAPPAGFVAGIYARNDIERAVYKAPANEVVNLAIGFERSINKAQQEVLNPEGINCLRFFEGRGYRVWGARTVSSDPEWKYVNLRRYFAYLERSIDVGTQWAVFEPNGERLWANVKRTIDDFLLNEWTNGALLGDRPEKAYFVKCDRSTMTQNDLDNGRLVCLIGVAALRPAEFVIFRIGQWTADRPN